jgi:hypothetical protein
MLEEFEGRDLSDAVFWDVALRRARFRDVDLTGARVTHSWIVDVDIDGFVDNVTINGVDVTKYVNEHDRWYPLRAMLRPTDAASMRATWDALEDAWAETLAGVTQITEAQLHESVDGEWSFVQTLQHLVFAMDKWFTAPVLSDGFASIGLPNTGSRDFGWPGLDLDAAPSFGQVLAVRRARAARLRSYLEVVTPDELTRVVDVLENGPHEVHDCIAVVFEEEFQHDRYAVRDLARLDASPS